MWVQGPKTCGSRAPPDGLELGSKFYNSDNPTVGLRKEAPGSGSTDRTPENHMAPTTSRCMNSTLTGISIRDFHQVAFIGEEGFTARVSPKSGSMDVILPCYQPPPSTSIQTPNSTINNQFSFFSVSCSDDQSEVVGFFHPLSVSIQVHETGREVVEENRVLLVLSSFFSLPLNNHPRTNTATTSTTTISPTTNSTTTPTTPSTTTPSTTTSTATTTSTTTSRHNTLLH